VGRRHKPPSSPLPEDLRERRKWKHLFRYENGTTDPEDSSDGPKSAPVSWRSLKRFWGFVHPHRHLVYLLFACTLINQSMTVVMPLAIGQVLDSVLPRHDGALLNLIALGLLLYVLLRAFYIYVNRELVAVTGLRIVRDVRTRLHVHMQAMSLSFLENYQVGRLVSRIMSDTDAIRNLLLGGIVNTASNAFRLIFISATLLWIDWRLTLVSCFTLPFFVAGIAGLIRRLKPAHKELSEDNARIWAKASETFSGARVVKTYNQEKREDLSFVKRIHLMLRKRLLVHRTHYIVAVVWEVSALLGLVSLIWYGGHRIISGALTTGDLVAFYGLLGLLHRPIADLINSSETVQQAMASIERIDEVLNEKPEIADRPGAIEAGVLKGEVAFEHVSFKYQDSGTHGAESGKPKERGAEGEARKRPVTVEDISFRVEPGECVALVGASGAGKTTLINLLARFYDVNSGCIRVDGVDIRDYRLASYRLNLAVVLQENFLFRGTIRENIAYARANATDAEIIRAARMASAWEFIEAHEEGLDALCGERGVKLSGGQQQRLSIARAILADPRILILDEATSALDSQAESQIQEALQSLMKNRTTFIVAHRLSTIVHADKILVLDQGRIVEMGTHEELLVREGRYFDLFMEQYGKVKFSGRTVEALGRWRKGQAPARRAQTGVRPAETVENPLLVPDLADRQGEGPCYGAPREVAAQHRMV